MTKAPNDTDRQLAAQARMVALVLAGTVVLWMGAQWLGGRIGLNARYVFLFDLAAMAAFIWALAVTWRIWQRQKSGAREN